MRLLVNACRSGSDACSCCWKFEFTVNPRPAMSAAGIEANFERDEIEYRLGAFHYSVGEHLDLLKEAGFANVEVEEFAGDEELAEAVPAAAKYLGFPVLLLLVASK